MREARMPFTLSISYRSRTYDVALSDSQLTLRQLGHEVARITGVSFETAKLLAPGVKGGLVPSQAAEHDPLPAGLKSGTRVLLLGSSEADVQQVRVAKELPGLASFDHELRRAAQRRRQGAGSSSLSAPTGTYTFGSYKAWEQPGLYPPPSVALQLLYRLAHDLGIRGVMEKHQYKVGLLSEMPPEGKVGVSAVCVLGYNVNAGQEISLRLRTDDLRGFRKYDNIRLTLIHELAHMEHSEHETPFKTLNSQLGREVQAILAQHSGGSLAALGGPTTLAGRQRGHHDRFMDDEDAADVDDPMVGDGWAAGGNGLDDVMAATSRSSGRTLRALAGGSQSRSGVGAATAATAREAAALAALQRFGAAASPAGANNGSSGAAALARLSDQSYRHRTSDQDSPAGAGAAAAAGGDSEGVSDNDRHSEPASDSDADPAGGAFSEFEHEDARTQEAEEAVLELEGRSSITDPAVPSTFGQQADVAGLTGATNFAPAQTQMHQTKLSSSSQAEAGPTQHAATAADGVQPMDVDVADIVQQPAAVAHPAVAGSGYAPASHANMDTHLPTADHAQPQLQHQPGEPSTAVPAAASTAAAAASPPVVVRLSSLHLSSPSPDATVHTAASISPAPAAASTSGGSSAEPHASSSSAAVVSGSDGDDVAAAKYTQAWTALRTCVDACGGDASQALSALQTLQTLLGNVVHQPGEGKFKTVKLGNGALRRKLGNGIAAAVEVMKTAGFVLQPAAGAAATSDSDGSSSGTDRGFAAGGGARSSGVSMALPDGVLVLKRNDPGLVWLVLAAVSAAIEEVEQQLRHPVQSQARLQQRAVGSIA